MRDEDREFLANDPGAPPADPHLRRWALEAFYFNLPRRSDVIDALSYVNKRNGVPSGKERLVHSANARELDEWVDRHRAQALNYYVRTTEIANSLLALYDYWRDEGDNPRTVAQMLDAAPRELAETFARQLREVGYDPHWTPAGSE